MKYFKVSEFDCKETGENEMDPEFLERLDILRAECEFPFMITSGYRSPKHSIEAKKKTPGKHAQGIAADIKCCNSVQRMIIVENALSLGFTGIGIHKNFVHVDIRSSVPVMWIY